MSVLKKNIAYNTILSLSQIIFPLITFPYSSRILGPEGIGAVSFADNFTAYFLIISALGIPLYGVREIAKVKDDKIKLGCVFSELLFIHLGTSVLAVLILFVISYNISRLSVDFGLYQIGMSIILGSVFISEWFFQGIEDFKFIAVRSVCIRLITIALLFLLVHSSKDKNVYYALNLIAVLLSAGTNMYYILKKIKISYKGVSFKRHLRPLLIILSNSFITTIYLVFDTIILGFLTNDISVGYYSASMRISKLSLAVIGVMSMVLLPRLTIAFQTKDLSEVKFLLNKSMNFVIFLSVPIAMGTVCLSREMVLLFAGNNYMPAVESLQILCFVVIFVGMAQVFSHQILLPMHMEKLILYASLIGVFVSLTLNFTLIPIFKHSGAAVSSLTTEILVTIVLFIYARKAIKVQFPFVQFIQSMVTCSLFFIIKYSVLKFSSNPVAVILFTIGISGILYLFTQIFIWKNKAALQTLSSFPSLKFLEKF